MELVNIGLLVILLGKFFITKDYRIGYLWCFIIGSLLEVLGFLQIGIMNSAVLNGVFLIWDLFTLIYFFKKQK